MSFTSVLLAVTQPLDVYFGVEKATTTWPLTPFLPLWMWAAMGVPIPLILVNFQHTSPVLVLTVIAALPEPLPATGGTSAFELNVPVRSTSAAAAVAGMATRAA